MNCTSACVRVMCNYMCVCVCACVRACVRMCLCLYGKASNPTVLLKSWIIKVCSILDLFFICIETQGLFFMVAGSEEEGLL